jgi:hypothetical protein
MEKLSKKKRVECVALFVEGVVEVVIRSMGLEEA